jgi:hypothetical protein
VCIRQSIWKNKNSKEKKKKKNKYIQVKNNEKKVLQVERNQIRTEK